MRGFINLFLSIALPLFVLFFIAATFYFSTNYELDKALKLGTIAGFLSALAFSFIITSILMSIRKIRKRHMDITHPESHIVHNTTSTGPINKKLMLLMDRELAFEVALYSIIDQNIGEVTKGSKHEGTINIHTPEQIINLSISPLTKHTSQIKVKANSYNESIKQIITYLKLKEDSFLKY
jgi:hypothetical protein